MSLSTYAALKTSVAGWMNVSASDLSSQIDDVVTLGETRVYREARTRDAETSYSTAMASGVVSVPSDYVEMKFLYLDGSPTSILERRSAEWVYTEYPTRSSSNRPRFWARDAGSFIFGPYPDSNYTVKGVYYKKFAALSSAVNNQFLNNPDLYLFACLAESEILIGRDSRIPIWEAKYNKILQDVNGLAKREDVSGSTLRMRLG